MTDRDAYGVDEAAYRLSVNERTVRNLIKSGKLRALKSGGRVLITPAAIREFLDSLPAA